MIIDRGLRDWKRDKLDWLSPGARLGFVPTMGALHEGHATLLRRARSENDAVLLSIFVNPTQFNDPKDLLRYPRTVESDLRLAEECGVDRVWLPEEKDLYPDQFTYRVDESSLSQILCGRTRPGHFTGVLSVVMKLFSLAQLSANPQHQRAYFGEKDFQQLELIRGMVRAFDLPWDIRPVATVRESDGLAMSSRNTRLSATARKLAPRLFQSLRNTPNLELARHELEAAGFRIDYLEEHSFPSGRRRFVAAFLEEVRLIDNVEI